MTRSEFETSFYQGDHTLASLEALLNEAVESGAILGEDAQVIYMTAVEDGLV